MFSAFGFGMLEKLATNASDIWGTGNKLRDTQREENMDDYLARERLGIQSRVDGAKAAGLHPLVAMNYQGGNSPSTLIGGSQLPNSQGYQRVAAEKPDPTLARINEANARRAEAEASKAELDLAASRRALATQPGQPIGAITGPTSPANLRAGRLNPGVVIKPDSVTAGVGGVTSGVHPGISRFDLPGIGDQVALPSQDASQAMEDLDLLKYATVYAANKDRINQYLASFYPFNWAEKRLTDWYKKPRGPDTSQARRDNRRDIRREDYLLLQRAPRRF